MAESWSDLEVELIVADYFKMLSDQLIGKDYSKAAHRRQLLPLLNNRSGGSIEFKHQNISAVLIKYGQPYIKGYLPRYNYQKSLEEKVLDYLARHRTIEQEFKHYAERDPLKVGSTIFEKMLVEPPSNDQFAEPEPVYGKNPIKTNYLEQEQRNTKLGKLGEELVLEYERWNLRQLGKDKLADQIEWISEEKGDGAGFDILSKYPNGKDKYVEVKTTKLGKDTPFFFSSNELAFSVAHANDYHLFRLFDFEKDTRIFVKRGGLDTICHSVPVSYKGFFRDLP